MPVTYTIDPDIKLIRTRCVGEVTLQDVLDHFRQLREDPVCPDHLDVLLDVAEIHFLPETYQLRAVSFEVRATLSKVRLEFCAVIAPTDALFGMLRIFEVMTQDYFRKLCVFRTAAEAEAWLAAQRRQAR